MSLFSHRSGFLRFTRGSSGVGLWQSSIGFKKIGELPADEKCKYYLNIAVHIANAKLAVVRRKTAEPMQYALNFSPSVLGRKVDFIRNVTLSRFGIQAIQLTQSESIVSDSGPTV